MNEVEGVYGQTDTGITVIEGIYFLKVRNQLLNEQVVV